MEYYLILATKIIVGAACFIWILEFMDDLVDEWIYGGAGR
jgi:hypothetical protein